MGSFASTDPGIRRQAIDLVKRGMDVAAEMGVDEILLWRNESDTLAQFWDCLRDRLAARDLRS